MKRSWLTRNGWKIKVENSSIFCKNGERISQKAKYEIEKFKYLYGDGEEWKIKEEFRKLLSSFVEKVFELMDNNVLYYKWLIEIDLSLGIVTLRCGKEYWIKINFINETRERKLSCNDYLKNDAGIIDDLLKEMEIL